MKRFIILIPLMASILLSCSKHEENEVNLNQFELDKSNDYRYIFKEDIEKEQREAGRKKVDPFKE